MIKIQSIFSLAKREKNINFFAMKKLLIICIAVLLFAGISNIGMAATNPQSSQLACDLKVSLVNQDPNPAVPNEYVKILVQVTGLENSECNGAAIELKPEYPFSLDPNYDAVQIISGTTYAQGHDSVWNVPFKLRIANDALEGDYQMKLIYHSGNSRDFSAFSIEKKLDISVTDSQTNFDTVIQEVSDSQVSIGIVNIGKNTANSMVASIPEQENYRTSGPSGQIVGNLAAGDYTIVTFNIMPKTFRNSTMQRSAQETGQMLKVQIDYTDGIGKRRSIIKEVYVSNMASSGNFSSRGMGGRMNPYNNQGIPIWWYAIGLAVLIIGIIAYRKYKEKKSQKHGAKDIPEWIQAEKEKEKK